MTDITYNEMNDKEERYVLSRRRAVFFVFLVGLVMLSLMFLLRMDVDINHNALGEQSNIVEKVTPVLPGPVATAIDGSPTDDAEERLAVSGAVQRNQQDPSLLVASLLGSLYNRTDFIHHKNNSV
uniref:Uncharacterized protein n=1 Tax=Chionoecetes opilio bacilliform virus TaxID=1825681 RepID=A0A1Q3DLB1_9VIRU|nr:wsv136-like protein [Chionoecetes opilio bacilliform virus]GAV93169.1 hypothetical protein SCV_045 [Chionoecetes opilio bacilliform virus]